MKQQQNKANKKEAAAFHHLQPNSGHKQMPGEE